MFKYVADISNIAQSIVHNFLENKNIAIDCTLGNGHDTDFLKDTFKKVYAFDVQRDAVLNYKNKSVENVFAICDSHHNLKKYINENVDCIMYNLGYLPGANKDITTLLETTLESIKIGLELLNPGGIMTIASYVGHDEGKKEYEGLISLLENLPTKKYGVMRHEFLNRHKNPPILLIIEKK